MNVRMWEAVVEPGELAAASEWVRDVVLPDALATPGCRGAEAFVADGDDARLVVVTRWDDGAPPWEEGQPERPLLRRSHSWGFRPLG